MTSISKLIQLYERWLLNILFKRSRLIRIELSDCIEETGYTFGPNGNHFMITALRAGNDEKSVADALRKYYAHNPAKSFDQIINRTSDSSIGEMYFMPWQADRVRPLSVFNASHRFGPTNEDDLKLIVKRLLNCLRRIKDQGLRQLTIPDGIIRVYAMVGKDGQRKYVIRDGQHRCSVLSYLGHESVYACYERTYYQRSSLYNGLRKLLGRPEISTKNYLDEVREQDVETWPHVQNGDVDKQAALDFFQAVFNRSTT